VPKGYIMFNETIRDHEAMAPYAAAAGQSMGEHRIGVLAVDPSPAVLEGSPTLNQAVLLEFESVEAARAWYESPAYQEALELRQLAADTDVILFSGV
jgi:uncharacterized protein (DUF1330 family)